MKPRRAVRFTPEAEAHAAEIHAWWAENRSAAPDLFAKEIASAIALLAGRRVPSEGKGVHFLACQATSREFKPNMANGCASS